MYSKLKFNKNYESRHQKFRYLISMIYHILKKDKSAQLVLFEKFLMNREFYDFSEIVKSTIPSQTKESLNERSAQYVFTLKF